MKTTAIRINVNKQEVRNYYTYLLNPQKTTFGEGNRFISIFLNNSYFVQQRTKVINGVIKDTTMIAIFRVKKYR